MHHSFVLQSSGALVGALVATLLSATALADETRHRATAIRTRFVKQSAVNARRFTR